MSDLDKRLSGCQTMLFKYEMDVDRVEHIDCVIGMGREKIKELEQKLSDAEKQIDKLKPLKGFILISPDTCKRYEELERQNEWISVEDRLPKKGQEVFIYCDYGQGECAIYNGLGNGNGYEFEWDYNGCLVENVTHWKPITPPEVDKDE